ncbi:carotenoid oxygenase family protein [Streptomyces sp. NPDC005202]|uniref:carotenoid oxygenase family protein n=1 Tax=Streptomyces sp. NPDC005202 TaxID=3157021 RepID=UPI0033AC07AE
MTEHTRHNVLRGAAAAGGAVFVPAHPTDPGAAKGAGYALAHVHHPDRGAAGLKIRAAQDFTGEPVARIHLRVPLGFHGSRIPDA